ncbi:hypothetical protein [Chryseobacterium sp. MDT2-18]|uniref:hypothetical protein n=1 Tax=Chryseobacterium sp. MDT2-18 TaxID=1259136 RepID=UPI0027892A7E|nr:hypothetical protein [Chryseobacterium sp. MDT2-18]MDQ0476707.1 hypothetical protein [Chryseobacterium sp. MDT2-18]
MFIDRGRCFWDGGVVGVGYSLNQKSGVIGWLKAFKKQESNEVIRRSQWLLWMFGQAGKRNSNVKKHQFWQQQIKPVEIGL